MKTRTLIRAGTFLTLFAASSLSLAQPTPPDHTNGPPSVRIVTPEPGEALLLGRNIHICALSQNFTDAVARVEFFAGTNSLGLVTNTPIVWGERWLGELSAGYACLTWSNATAGSYVLTAAATDMAGNSVTSAPVNITVVSNLPPLVRIVEPGNGAAILGPTNVMVCASASDPDGTVATVQFFAGTTSLGVVTSTPTLYVTNRHGVFPIHQTSYCVTWSNAAPGAYALTAVATDNAGASTTSAPVDVTIVTNLPPRVALESPRSGARFFAPATINVCAVAGDKDGSVASVEFFQGAASLGRVTNGITLMEHMEVRGLYCLTWSNVPPAAYTLTAVATDNVGLTSTSGPVAITVPPPPPPAVKIVNPENGERFFAPASIYIAATTRYFTNPIAQVQFLANASNIGVVSNSTWPTFHWTNVSAGTYGLTAVATDTKGVMATSPPVNITVVTNPPPRRFHY